MSALAPLTDPALLRSLIRSLPATPSPGPATPASDRHGKNPIVGSGSLSRTSRRRSRPPGMTH